MTVSTAANPPSRLQSRGQYLCTVHENAPLCREHFRLVLTLPSFPPTDPGQFIQIGCRDVEGDEVEPTGGSNVFQEHEIDWQPGVRPQFAGVDLHHPTAVLRRPFSLAGRRDTPDGVELDIIHRVVGIGTDWMSRLGPGDAVSIIGPLGNRFELPQTQSQAILVGGGVGIPPMIYLAERLAGRNAVVFSGALTRDLLPLRITDETRGSPDSAEPRLNVAEFTRHGIPAVLTTDDGSYEFRGFVTQALERYLDRLGFAVLDCGLKTADSSVKSPSHANPQSAIRIPQSPPTIYTCGPEPMMKRVADIALSRGLPCQIAVERAMACGMGTCQSCCIRVRKPDPAAVPLPGRDWCYRLACTDGPVFRAAELLW